MPTQHSTVRIVWILEYGMVWGLSRGTGGWAEWSHHHQLDGHHHHQQMALVPPWWWVRDDIFPPIPIKCYATIFTNHSYITIILKCKRCIIVMICVSHQQIAGQPQGMHRCTPRCYKKDKVSIFGRSLPIGQVYWVTLYCPAKSAVQSKVAPRKRFTTPEFKCWSLLLWKIGYTLELSGSSQETILRVVLFSS